MIYLGQSNSKRRSKPESALGLHLWRRRRWAHSLIWGQFKSLWLFLLNGAGIKALHGDKEKIKWARCRVHFVLTFRAKP